MRRTLTAGLVGIKGAVLVAGVLTVGMVGGVIATAGNASHPTAIVQRSDATTPTTAPASAPPTTTAPVQAPVASPVPSGGSSAPTAAAAVPVAPPVTPPATTPTTVATVTVPNVVGDSYTAAIDSLDSAGLPYSVEGLPCSAPSVAAESPPAGTQVAPGTSIYVSWVLSCAS